jgi:hypothetical protein
VNACREGIGVRSRGGADDQVLPAALNRIPLLLEPISEIARLPVRRQRHSHLPGGEAAIERVRLPGLRGRLVAPAVFVVEPPLDRAGDSRDVVVAELRLDDRASALRLFPVRCVDEDLVSVLGDGEPPRLQLACELGGLACEAEAEPVQEAAPALLVDVDPDAVVVGYAGILPNSAMPSCSRCFVMPPRKNG